MIYYNSLSRIFFPASSAAVAAAVACLFFCRGEKSPILKTSADDLSSGSLPPVPQIFPVMSFPEKKRQSSPILATQMIQTKNSQTKNKKNPFNSS